MSLTPQSQGQESNHSGKFLEETIEREFRVRKVDVSYWREGRGTLSLFAEHRLMKNVPYISIYGCHSKSEFVYWHQPTDLKVRIECRWQQSDGSVDEKFPYLLANAQRMPEPFVWFIVDGDGARKEAVAWLRREAPLVKRKIVRIYSLIETRKAVKSLLERQEA